MRMTKRSREEELARIEQARKLPAMRTLVFYLDPQLHYAIRRREERYGQTLLARTTNNQFERIPGRDAWLPRKSVIDHYTSPKRPGEYSNTPISTETCEVTQLRTERMSDRDFVLTYDDVPGTRVLDASIDGPAIEHRVPETAASEGASPLGANMLWPVAILIAMLVAIIMTAAWRLRRRHQAAEVVP
jgi:hypothetical protein